MEEKISEAASHDEFAISTARHECVFSWNCIVTKLYSPSKIFRNSAEIPEQQMRDAIALDRPWRSLRQQMLQLHALELFYPFVDGPLSTRWQTLRTCSE